MNFLTLCQRTREKCGVSGTGPSTVLGQTGELLRIVNWVNEAWLDIQNEEDNWDWMRSDFSLQLVANTQAYAPTVATDTVASAAITNFRAWREDTFRIYDPAVGLTSEGFILPWDWDRFRNFYNYQAQPAGKPSVFAIRPRDKALAFGNTPDYGYVVRGEYQKGAWLMAADADIPDIPSDNHLLIVYRAMMKYGAYENAPEVYSEGERGWRDGLLKLTQTQIGNIQIGPTLA